MALKLKLKAEEKVIVNGALIVNGDRPATLTVLNFANILRESDVMQEEEADTPVRRAYFVAQLMLLDPDNAGSYRGRFDGFIADLQSVFVNPEVRDLLQTAVDSVAQANYYKAMAALRKAMKYEALLFSAARLQG